MTAVQVTGTTVLPGVGVATTFVGAARLPAPAFAVPVPPWLQ